MRGVRAGDSSRVSLGGISRGSYLSRWGGAAWGHPRKMPPEERGEARVEHCLGEPFRGQAGGRDIILWTGGGGGRRVKVRTQSILSSRPGPAPLQRPLPSLLVRGSAVQAFPGRRLLIRACGCFPSPTCLFCIAGWLPSPRAKKPLGCFQRGCQAKTWLAQDAQMSFPV